LIQNKKTYFYNNETYPVESTNYIRKLQIEDLLWQMLGLTRTEQEKLTEEQFEACFFYATAKAEIQADKIAQQEANLKKTNRGSRF